MNKIWPKYIFIILDSPEITSWEFPLSEWCPSGKQSCRGLWQGQHLLRALSKAEGTVWPKYFLPAYCLLSSITEHVTLLAPRRRDCRFACNAPTQNNNAHCAKHPKVHTSLKKHTQTYTIAESIMRAAVYSTRRISFPPRGNVRRTKGPARQVQLMVMLLNRARSSMNK